MMSSPQSSMTDAQVLAALFAEDAVTPAGEHPELDELAAYLAGELTPEAEARLQDHLTKSRASTEKLLDLESLQPSEPQASGVADLAMAAGWREQKKHIAELEGARRQQRTMRFMSAVAATFVLATVGLTAHVTQLRQTIAGLESPEANVPIVYLDSAAVRSEADAVTATLSPDVRSLLLIITPDSAGPEPWPDYEAEVLSATGAQIWSGGGLALSESDTVRLRLPRSLLPAGDYEIRLYGVDGDRREQLRSSPLRVRDQ